MLRRASAMITTEGDSNKTGESVVKRIDVTELDGRAIKVLKVV